MGCQRRMLTDADREEISRGIAEGLEGKVIAARIRWCPNVVSREITRHGGRPGYRARDFSPANLMCVRSCGRRW